jgi:acyl-CoA synthetase (AMP-forming)/AMP-acid ligase II
MRTTPEERIEDFTARGWWGDVTLTTLFDQAVSARPGNLALVDPFNRADLTDGAPQRLTFSEIDRRADSLAVTFYKHGVRQDDVVVIQLPNVVELVMLYIALSKLGVVVSPVPVQYGVHELAKIQQELRPRAYVSVASLKGNEFAAVNREAFSPECTVFTFGEEVPDGAIGLDGEPPGTDDLNSLQAYVDSLSVSANDVFTICWTSGTTGKPKGVPRTHNMWMTSAFTTYDVVRFTEEDVSLNPFPLVNMASIGGFLYNWLLSQSRLVLHHPLDLHVFLKQLELEKVTYTIAPPAVLTMLLKDPAIMAATDLSTMRIMGSGGAPLSPWMVREYQEKLDIIVINIFGSNEGMVLISGHEDIPDPEIRAEYFPRFGVEGFKWNNRVAGRVKTRLVDIHTGEEITEPGKPGELLLWGASVFDGYYNAPETNRKVFSEDGFFHTGDMFEVPVQEENQRFYHFVGRCKDIIVRGGVKISPDEIDSLLAAHPKIAEVAVVGYADEIMEERICAVVVPKPGEKVALEDLTDFLLAKKVAVFKLPEKLVIVDQLPRNPLGKVLRGDLKVMVARG